jgi:hypothetical protein
VVESRFGQSLIPIDVFVYEHATPNTCVIVWSLTFDVLMHVHAGCVSTINISLIGMIFLRIHIKLYGFIHWYFNVLGMYVFILFIGILMY